MTRDDDTGATRGEAEIDFELLNRGIQIAAQLMYDEGVKVNEALDRGWRAVGLDPATIPISLKKRPGMLLPGLVEAARRDGTPVRGGRWIPVNPPAGRNTKQPVTSEDREHDDDGQRV